MDEKWRKKWSKKWRMEGKEGKEVGKTEGKIMKIHTAFANRKRAKSWTE